MYDSTIASHPNTILTLNHEVVESTAYVHLTFIFPSSLLIFSRHNVLPHALEALTNAGYRLVTVAECLGVDAYNSTFTPFFNILYLLTRCLGVGSPSERDVRMPKLIR